jgi:hypothetical protein
MRVVNIPDDKTLKLQKMEEKKLAKIAEKKNRTVDDISIDGSIDKHMVNQVMFFKIYRNDHQLVKNQKRLADDPLVIKLKEEINAMKIARKDLYSYIGEGSDSLFKNENQVYNLEYGLRKRSTISLDSARKWLVILGKEMVIEFVDIDENI